MTPPVLVDDTTHVEARQLDAAIDAIHAADEVWLDARDRAAAAMIERRTDWETFLDVLRAI